jgi:hypothetical protein
MECMGMTSNLDLETIRNVGSGFSSVEMFPKFDIRPVSERYRSFLTLPDKDIQGICNYAKLYY